MKSEKNHVCLYNVMILGFFWHTKSAVKKCHDLIKDINISCFSKLIINLSQPVKKPIIFHDVKAHHDGGMGGGLLAAGSQISIAKF